MPTLLCLEDSSRHKSLCTNLNASPTLQTRQNPSLVRWSGRKVGPKRARGCRVFRWHTTTSQWEEALRSLLSIFLRMCMLVGRPGKEPASLTGFRSSRGATQQLGGAHHLLLQSHKKAPSLQVPFARCQGAILAGRAKVPAYDRVDRLLGCLFKLLSSCR